MEPSAGLLPTLRTLGDGLLAGLHDRLALFAVELQEEKFRLIQTFVWISAVVFIGMMSAAFASITLVYLFWESARLLALVSLTLFYLVALGLTIVAFRLYLARQPQPFAASLEELGADRSCIRKPS